MIKFFKNIAYKIVEQVLRRELKKLRSRVRSLKTEAKVMKNTINTHEKQISKLDDKCYELTKKYSEMQGTLNTLLNLHKN